MQDHRKLRVFAESMDLCEAVYKCAERLPRHQMFVLTSQLKKAALSVALNIAEGAGRRTAPDFAHFLDISLGSTNEIECCLDLAVRLRYLTADVVKPLHVHLQNVRRMLCGLTRILRSGTRVQPPPMRRDRSLGE